MSTVGVASSPRARRSSLSARNMEETDENLAVRVKPRVSLGVLTKAAINQSPAGSPRAVGLKRFSLGAQTMKPLTKPMPASTVTIIQEAPAPVAKALPSAVAVEESSSLSPLLPVEAHVPAAPVAALARVTPATPSVALALLARSGRVPASRAAIAAPAPVPASSSTIASAAAVSMTCGAPTPVRAPAVVTMLTVARAAASAADWAKADAYLDRCIGRADAERASEYWCLRARSALARGLPARALAEVQAGRAAGAAPAGALVDLYAELMRSVTGAASAATVIMPVAAQAAAVETAARATLATASAATPRRAAAPAPAPTPAVSAPAKATPSRAELLQRSAQLVRRARRLAGDGSDASPSDSNFAESKAPAPLRFCGDLDSSLDSITPVKAAAPRSAAAFAAALDDAAETMTAAPMPAALMAVTITVTEPDSKTAHHAAAAMPAIAGVSIAETPLMFKRDRPVDFDAISHLPTLPRASVPFSPHCVSLPSSAATSPASSVNVRQRAVKRLSLSSATDDDEAGRIADEAEEEDIGYESFAAAAAAALSGSGDSDSLLELLRMSLDNPSSSTGSSGSRRRAAKDSPDSDEGMQASKARRRRSDRGVSGRGARLSLDSDFDAHLDSSFDGPELASERLNRPALSSAASTNDTLAVPPRALGAASLITSAKKSPARARRTGLVGGDATASGLVGLASPARRSVAHGSVVERRLAQHISSLHSGESHAGDEDAHVDAVGVGASVVVLESSRASGAQRRRLGTEFVLSPVRRSKRNLTAYKADADASVAASLEGEATGVSMFATLGRSHKTRAAPAVPAVEQAMVDLMMARPHAFAFVPNPALNDRIAVAMGNNMADAVAPALLAAVEPAEKVPASPRAPKRPAAAALALPTAALKAPAPKPPRVGSSTVVGGIVRLLPIGARTSASAKMAPKTSVVAGAGAGDTPRPTVRSRAAASALPVTAAAPAAPVSPRRSARTQAQQ